MQKLKQSLLNLTLQALDRLGSKAVSNDRPLFADSGLLAKRLSKPNRGAKSDIN